MVQNSSYYCALNLSDNDFDTKPLFARVLFYERVIFNLSMNGTINFTPSNDAVGNHSVLFIVSDNSTCANQLANVSWNFSVLNINDPPYLYRNISDQSFSVNTTLAAFFLTDHFRDPDGDPMTFNHTVVEGSGISISIANSSLVTFYASTCLEDDDNKVLVQFFAKDPYNATAGSNVIEVEVKCDDDEDSATGDGDGEGGGGGGGSSFLCSSEWECEEWFPCLPAGVQWRRCYDTHGCEVDKYLKQACEYSGIMPACQEDWLCDDWSKCYLNGTQYRACRDLEGCGTTLVAPPESQQCTYLPTCEDGVLNGDETSTDCGGSCAACPIVEQPANLLDEGWLTSWILALIITGIILVSGVLHYYRAQISQFMALIEFMLKHRAYKDILLDAPQRKSLFERLFAFEQLLKTEELKQMEPNLLYGKLSLLVRGFVSDALVLPIEALPEEVSARCRELGLRPETALLLEGIFSKLAILEQEDLELDDFFVLSTVEEVRTLVCLTSDYSQDELLRPIEEIKVSDDMSFYDEIFVRSVNLLRALQFNQIDVARKEYLTMLSRYEPLSVQEKEQIYPELKWFFETVRFQSQITGAKVVRKPAVISTS